jgi:DNA-directed RNA polymerase specialized sigma24 family protein
VEERERERDRDADEVAQLRSQRGPDPVPALPPGLEVSAKEWEDAWIAVLGFLLNVTKSNARADDIRQEAYARLFTTRRWTPDREKPFLRHMLLTASSLLKHEYKAGDRRKKYEQRGGAVYLRERGRATPSPEHDLLEHAERVKSRDEALRVLGELRRRLAGFPLELRLIDQAEQAEASGDELDTPAELAKILGVGVDEVYRARARIRRYRESVVAAVRGPDEESE